ncbi:MAG: VacB/RNase II family 3'-5' exoribonuclease [Phycisphaeraceae bacterium]|nr:VacB/RNase II family 3'-5' exoribonuclease [Phycisphaeraceae bacterium]
MTLKYKQRLLDHLQHDRYEPATLRAVAADLGIADGDLDDFKSAVAELAKAGSLILDNRNGSVPADAAVIKLPSMPDEITGSFRKNQRGFGFVITDIPYREGDLFIPREETLDALTGDRVRVKVERTIRRGERDTTGIILEVLKRKRKSFTGELNRRGGLWVVFPDGKELTQPITVPDASSKNAKPGDKVVVEMVRYPEGDSVGEGVVVRVLGEAGLPDVETQAVIAAYDLPSDDFPESCVHQARQAASRFAEEVERGEAAGEGAFKGRLDLRHDFIITIDPPDAKDYDDAISIRRITVDGPGGKEPGWELGVHIADVAHFIPPDSALDVEARERGNSCYLPRHVIPMLPEILSNGICSLQEGVVRYCKSAFMTYGRDGRVIKEGVAQTVIKSAKRLTYLEAQALIDGDLKEAVKHAKTEPKYTDDLIRMLREMDTCSRAIRERRKRSGMIHLELPEVNLVFDDNGHVVDAEPEDNAYTHTLIEMFMVEANEVLARLFEGVSVPLIRRIHPEPTPGDVQELQMYARVAGYKIPKKPTREELQSLLDATAGTGAARAVHMAVLRTLTKAEYSPALIGHYALASEAYAHFTSPIRRYADLTVHRALAEYLARTDNGTSRPRDEKSKRELGREMMENPRTSKHACPDQDELVEIARHITGTEQNAEGAERNLRQFLVLQLLQEHIGESFEGIITGVNPSGVFVQLEKYLADGFIKSADLPAGGKEGQARFGVRWQVDPRSGALVSQTGRSFNIGDRLSVTIAAIDLALRKMDLAVSDPNARAAGKNKAAPTRSGGLGGGGLAIDYDVLKNGRTGADRRAQRSKSRERNKSDFRQQRKKGGKR